MSLSRWLLLCACLAGCDFPKNPPPDMALDMTLPGDDMRAGPAARCTLAGATKVISNLPGDHAFPRVAFTGTHFVVAWNTAVQVAGTPRHRIVAALADRDGNKLGPNIPITSQAVADPGAPSVAALLGGTVLAWARAQPAAGNKDTFDIILNTLDQTGQRLDASGKPCDPGDEACGQFQVTDSGRASQPFLSRPQVDQHSAGPTDNQVSLAYIVSQDCMPGPCVAQNDVYWKKLQTNGTELVPEKRLTTVTSRYAFPRMAFDGAKNGIVWRDDRNPVSEFHFATIDPQGQLGGPPGKIGTAMGAYVSAGGPDLVWTGADYTLVTANGSDTSATVLFQRFQSNGLTTLGPVGVTAQGVACTPGIAWNGELFGVVWQTNCGRSGSDIAFEVLDAEGFRLRPDGTRCDTNPTCGVLRVTSNTTAVASFPEIVWAGGKSFGIAWMATDPSFVDSGGTPPQIYFNRVDCASE